MDRRTFLTSASALLATTALPTRAAAIEPVRRAGKSQLRIGLAGYSMRQYLQAKPGAKGAMDLLGFIDYAASLGVDAVELTSYFFPETITDAYLNEVKRRCHVNGLDISGGAIRNNFTLPDGDPELQKWFDHTEMWLGHYQKLGAPVVRVFSGIPPKGMTEEQGIANAIANLRKALVGAERHGVILGLENHDYLTKIDRMLPIIKAIDSPWFGVNLDSGNVDTTDVFPELAKIVPFAVNVQLKVETGPPKQKVTTDVPRFVKMLKDAGYRGYVVLEYESAPDPYEAIPKHLDELRAAIAKACTPHVSVAGEGGGQAPMRGGGQATRTWRMQRQQMIDRLEHTSAWDVVVIGGGATGVGIAVDAASRGYEVALVEQHDFGKGTSSRSTKLAHGGVRYLEQGNISLVMEALKERGLMRQNAPHLVSNLAFVVPNYDWWEAPFYGLGLKVYNVLAGKYGFGSSEILSRDETLRRLPTIKTDGLLGGVVYYDGQFDDARLLVNLAQTAAEQGAAVANYVQAVALTKAGDGFVNGVVARDVESGREFTLRAKVVINATGPFSDSVRRLAEPGAPPLIAPSQGIHLVFAGSFLRADSAIMVPHTSDGRVMFAIPWHGHTLVGTTDTPITAPTLEPVPFDEEVAFILDTASQYLDHAPSRADVLSVFVGIRPLVKSGDSRLTAALSRDHTIHIDASGLLTTTGGKWTTYRHMAEATVDQAADLARLPERPCVTRALNIHGFQQPREKYGHLGVYGSDAPAVQALGHDDAALAQPLDAALPYTGAEVVWAVRKEMARSVEDVLARRTRALFLDAKAATRMAPAVGALMAGELGKDDEWARQEVARFTALAAQYTLS